MPALDADTVVFSVFPDMSFCPKGTDIYYCFIKPIYRTLSKRRKSKPVDVHKFRLNEKYSRLKRSNFESANSVHIKYKLRPFP